MKNLENKKYWVWFSLIKHLGIKRKQQLLNKYKNPKNIYKLSKEELMQNFNIGENIANNIVDKSSKNVLKNHIKYMEKNNINIISVNDKEYPQYLKQIYDYPISLYIKGNMNILNEKSIAIIGCRNATEYGKKSAEYFSYNLAKNNINIVSGLARGIDSFAHIGALAANGKTIAVVGNGLDMIYPKENEQLQKKIIALGGAIISEYPLGTKPEKMNFPARNRIISGLCEKILVIEAKERSGTMLTVDFALEQGREVYAVPRKYQFY